MKWLTNLFRKKENEKTDSSLTADKTRTRDSVYGTLPNEPISLETKNEILKTIESSQKLPAGFGYGDFSEETMPLLAKKLQQYEIMPNPQSEEEKILGMPIIFPRYEMTNGMLRRFGNPENDAKIVSVASCLSGAGSIEFNERTISMAYDAIKYYVDLPISKFMLFIPLVYLVVASRAASHDYSSPNISMDEVEKTKFYMMENILFEIYEELGEGEKITDDLVADKFRRIINNLEEDIKQGEYCEDSNSSEEKKIEEINTRDIEQLIEILSMKAIPSCPEISVQEAMKKVNEVWTDSSYTTGTVEEICRLIELNLKEDITLPDFTKFNIVSCPSYDNKCIDISSLRKNTVNVYRIWRTDNKLYMKGSLKDTILSDNLIDSNGTVDSLEWFCEEWQHGLVVALPYEWVTVSSEPFIIAPPNVNEIQFGPAIILSPSINILLQNPPVDYDFKEGMKRISRDVSKNLEDYVCCCQKFTNEDDRIVFLDEFNYSRGETPFKSYRLVLFYPDYIVKPRMLSIEFSGALNDVNKYSRDNIIELLKSFGIRE